MKDMLLDPHWHTFQMFTRESSAVSWDLSEHDALFAAFVILPYSVRPGTLRYVLKTPLAKAATSPSGGICTHAAHPTEVTRNGC
jgi:hypothetical protein